MPGFCHREIARYARRIANEFYEVGARENLFHELNPNRAVFVDKYWGQFVQPATKALQARLDDPETSLPVKLEIAEILALDATAPKGRHGASPAAGFDDRDWARD